MSPSPSSTRFLGTCLLLVVFLFGDVSAFAPSKALVSPFTTTTTTTTTTSLFVQNTPERFDMEELKHRIRQASGPQLLGRTTTFAQPQQMTSMPKTVHIVLFRPGTPQQGAHTIEHASGSNVILAFSSKRACQKFARALQHQGFVDPTPTEFQLTTLTNKCDSLNGVFVEVVPEGVDLIPPSKTVQTFGIKTKLMEDKRYLQDLMERQEDSLMDDFYDYFYWTDRMVPPEEQLIIGAWE